MKYLALLTAVAVLSLGAVSRAGNRVGDPGEPLGWQMAIHERTFEKYTVFEAMDKTKALGVKYMSFSGRIPLGDKSFVAFENLTDEQIQAIKKHAQGDGLTLVNAYAPLPADEARCRKSFESARKLGLDTLVGEPSPEALDTVEKLCKEYHIRVAIHDHPQPSHYWDPQMVLDAIQGRGPLMGARADTGHWVRSGLDPVQCLKRLQGHVFCLHFKDLNAQGRDAHDVPWGTGVGRCKDMMVELKRQGFHGAFCAEYEYDWYTSMPALAQCVKFFNTTRAELATDPTRP